MRDILASLDVDVQTATTVINDLVTALGAATGSGVSAADQTALETAITAGQAAVAPTSTAPAATPVPVPEPAPATPVTSPEVS
jgi:hypothetical protein